MQDLKLCPRQQARGTRHVLLIAMQTFPDHIKTRNLKMASSDNVESPSHADHRLGPLILGVGQVGDLGDLERLRAQLEAATLEEQSQSARRERLLAESKVKEGIRADHQAGQRLPVLEKERNELRRRVEQLEERQKDWEQTQPLVKEIEALRLKDADRLTGLERVKILEIENEKLRRNDEERKKGMERLDPLEKENQKLRLENDSLKARIPEFNHVVALATENERLKNELEGRRLQFAQATTTICQLSDEADNYLDEVEQLTAMCRQRGIEPFREGGLRHRPA